MIDLPLARDKIKNARAVFFDFDGVFTDNSVYVTEGGMESVRCWRTVSYTHLTLPTTPYV